MHEWEAHGCVNALTNLPIDFDQAGAQYFVAQHDAIQCRLQGVDVQCADQAHAIGHVVADGCLRVQLGEQPHALLHEGSR